MKHFVTALYTLILLLLSSQALAATRTVDLTMRYQLANKAGSEVKAVTVNGQIPAPELRFTEGDEVIINLHNELDEPGSIHWHGLLVPYKMDGVPWVSMPPVMPGETFQYRFTLRQSGTYWYHSHSKLHEQQGLYGSFIVEPKKESLSYDREVAVMLSDWTNRHPNETYKNLKKDGDYYKSFRPNWKFYWDEYRQSDQEQRQVIRETIAHMQQMRMGVWDWGDVAYDAFLLNGQPPATPWTAAVKHGERVRVRIVNGGASTYFNLRIDGADNFTVVAVDGQNVEPVIAERILLGMAETYDILVDIKEDKPYVIYAEAQDRTGHSIGILKTRPDQPDTANVKPFNDPWFEAGGHDHAAMKHEKPMEKNMDHRQHMAGKPEAVSKLDSAKLDHAKLDYANLKSSFVTNDPEEEVIDITLRLTGNMERYIWSFDNIRYRDASPIMLEEDKTYRMTLINETMMHHPIHIHGHWFVLDNGSGKYNPRKHTIDVPPMGQRVAKVHALDSGKWVFHCHNLYHMKAGMTRLIKYTNLPAEAPHYPDQHSRQQGKTP